MKRIVIVDDDRRTRRILQILVQRLGLESRAFERAEDALTDLEAESAVLVLTDLKMPGTDGIAFMRRLRQLDAQVPVIVLTAFGTVEAAVEAMKLGAVDFLAKPFDVDALELLIRRSLEASRHRVENRYLRERAASAPPFADIVGDSPPMRRVFELIRKVAPTKSAVLVGGETGTGKELVARAIHELSPRAGQLFVPLNCAAVPSELLESELFGHVRGAFSGAHSDREGRFGAADGGTLFLDEIGDMDQRLQAKFLAIGESPWMSASCRRPTAISSRRSGTADFAKTSSTASTCSGSRCPRCASAATCRPSPRPFSPSSAGISARAHWS
jgi:two-component system response regulator AtoC